MMKLHHSRSFFLVLPLLLLVLAATSSSSSFGVLAQSFEDITSCPSGVKELTSATTKYTFKATALQGCNLRLTGTATKVTFETVLRSNISVADFVCAGRSNLETTCFLFGNDITEAGSITFKRIQFDLKLQVTAAHFKAIHFTSSALQSNGTIEVSDCTSSNAVHFPSTSGEAYLSFIFFECNQISASSILVRGNSLSGSFTSERNAYIKFVRFFFDVVNVVHRFEVSGNKVDVMLTSRSDPSNLGARLYLSYFSPSSTSGSLSGLPEGGSTFLFENNQVSGTVISEESSVEIVTGPFFLAGTSLDYFDSLMISNNRILNLFADSRASSLHLQLALFTPNCEISLRSFSDVVVPNNNNNNNNNLEMGVIRATGNVVRNVTIRANSFAFLLLIRFSGTLNNVTFLEVSDSSLSCNEISSAANQVEYTALVVQKSLNSPTTTSSSSSSGVAGADRKRNSQIVVRNVKMFINSLLQSPSVSMYSHARVVSLPSPQLALRNFSLISVTDCSLQIGRYDGSTGAVVTIFASDASLENIDLVQVSGNSLMISSRIKSSKDIVVQIFDSEVSTVSLRVSAFNISDNVVFVNSADCERECYVTFSIAHFDSNGNSSIFLQPPTASSAKITDNTFICLNNNSIQANVHNNNNNNNNNVLSVTLYILSVRLSVKSYNKILVTNNSFSKSKIDSDRLYFYFFRASVLVSQVNEFYVSHNVAEQIVGVASDFARLSAFYIFWRNSDQNGSSSFNFLSASFNLFTNSSLIAQSSTAEICIVSLDQRDHDLQLVNPFSSSSSKNGILFEGNKILSCNLQSGSTVTFCIMSVSVRQFRGNGGSSSIRFISNKMLLGVSGEPTQSIVASILSVADPVATQPQQKKFSDFSLLSFTGNNSVDIHSNDPSGRNSALFSFISIFGCIGKTVENIGKIELLDSFVRVEHIRSQGGTFAAGVAVFAQLSSFLQIKLRSVNHFEISRATCHAIDCSSGGSSSSSSSAPKQLALNLLTFSSVVATNLTSVSITDSSFLVEFTEKRSMNGGEDFASNEVALSALMVSASINVPTVVQQQRTSFSFYNVNITATPSLFSTSGGDVGIGVLCVLNQQVKDISSISIVNCRVTAGRAVTLQGGGGGGRSSIALVYLTGKTDSRVISTISSLSVSGSSIRLRSAPSSSSSSFPTLRQDGTNVSLFALGMPIRDPDDDTKQLQFSLSGLSLQDDTGSDPDFSKRRCDVHSCSLLKINSGMGAAANVDDSNIRWSITQSTIGPDSETEGSVVSAFDSTFSANRASLSAKSEFYLDALRLDARCAIFARPFPHPTLLSRNLDKSSWTFGCTLPWARDPLRDFMRFANETASKIDFPCHLSQTNTETHELSNSRELTVSESVSVIPKYISPLRAAAKAVVAVATYGALSDASSISTASRMRGTITLIGKIKNGECGAAADEDEAQENVPDFGTAPLASLGWKMSRAGFLLTTVLGNIIFILASALLASVGFFALFLFKESKKEKKRDRRARPTLVEVLYEGKVAAVVLFLSIMFLDPILSTSIVMMISEFVEPPIRFAVSPIVIILVLAIISIVFWKTFFSKDRNRVEKYVPTKKKREENVRLEKQMERRHGMCYLSVRRFYFYFLYPEQDIQIPEKPRAAQRRSGVVGGEDISAITADDIDRAKLAYFFIKAATDRFTSFLAVDVAVLLVFALGTAVGAGVEGRVGCIVSASLIILALALHTVVVIFYRPSQRFYNTIASPFCSILQITMISVALAGVSEDETGELMLALAIIQLILTVVGVLALRPVAMVYDRIYNFLYAEKNSARARQEEEDRNWLREHGQLEEGEDDEQELQEEMMLRRSSGGADRRRGDPNHSPSPFSSRSQHQQQQQQQQYHSPSHSNSGRNQNVGTMMSYSPSARASPHYLTSNSFQQHHSNNSPNNNRQQQHRQFHFQPQQLQPDHRHLENQQHQQNRNPSTQYHSPSHSNSGRNQNVGTMMSYSPGRSSPHHYSTSNSFQQQEHHSPNNSPNNNRQQQHRQFHLQPQQLQPDHRHQNQHLQNQHQQQQNRNTSRNNNNSNSHNETEEDRDPNEMLRPLFGGRDPPEIAARKQYDREQEERRKRAVIEQQERRRKQEQEARRQQQESEREHLTPALQVLRDVQIRMGRDTAEKRRIDDERLRREDERKRKERKERERQRHRDFVFETIASPVNHSNSVLMNSNSNRVNTPRSSHQQRNSTSRNNNNNSNSIYNNEELARVDPRSNLL